MGVLMIRRSRRSQYLAVLGFLCFPSTPAQERGEPVTLELGATSERSLSPRAAATSRIHVSFNQFCRLRLEPNGVSLSATLQSPAGDKIAEVINLAGERKPISISWIGAVEGNYSLQVALRGKTPGRYRLALAELRATEHRDPDRISAERSFAEGRRLRLHASRASFIQAI
jgi:hypothetical protein